MEEAQMFQSRAAWRRFTFAAGVTAIAGFLWFWLDASFSTLYVPTCPSFELRSPIGICRELTLRVYGAMAVASLALGATGIGAAGWLLTTRGKK
jgi:hypothetical protein